MTTEELSEFFQKLQHEHPGKSVFMFDFECVDPSIIFGLSRGISYRIDPDGDVMLSSFLVDEHGNPV